MTNTITLDTKATVAQCIELYKAGCDFVRMATPSIKDAENIVNIKKLIEQQGFTIPIIADIHFNPKVAEVAARYAEKIRINPGNFTDRALKTNKPISDTENAEHFERMRKKAASLISICKEYGTAMRIGINHGSLSERIINRHGNTAEGMLESALEFIKICESFDYKNIVISMKSSNVLTMVQATRLLMKYLIKEGNIYPIHLGLTEAGSIDEGIVKSAVACGALLNYGIGDTIRVSLTGNPIIEVPIAKKISNFFNNIRTLKPNNINDTSNYEYLNDNKFFSSSNLLEKTIGISYPVVTNYEDNNFDLDKILEDSGLIYKNNMWKKCNISPDFININLETNNENIKSEVSILNHSIFCSENKKFIRFDKNKKSDFEIIPLNIDKPIIINDFFASNKNENIFVEITPCSNIIDFQINTSLSLGTLLLNNALAGIVLNFNYINKENINYINIIFEILQASRKRINYTEYVSCPTCGRTSYDVLQVLKRIKEKIGFKYNLKIAVMGCVVNGPGEMADADYGYVGTSKKRVNIYKRGDLVYKNIAEDEAIDKLYELIIGSE